MQQERRNDIVSKIHKQRIVKVSDLMRDYQVSIETIRKDLEFLEGEGHLKRVYGGAVLHDFYGSEMAYSFREHTNYLEKQAIGKKAAEFIDDGDVIFIDSGTTTIELVRHIAPKKDLTVLTHALFIAQELASRCRDCRVILLGGELFPEGMYVSGSIAESNLDNFFAAKAFISIGGITPDTGVTDYGFHEVSMKRIAVRRSKKIIGLADCSKFGITTMNRILPLDQLSVLITDWTVPQTILDTYRAMGIEVCTAPVAD